MASDLPTKFGKILRQEREARELSQEQLAFDCELDRTYISLLERGRRQPTLTTLFALAKVLEIRPSELIRRLEVSARRTIR